MPTRTDAQGLMMCEMATYGMPVITTDIPVCHEVLDSFENVSMFDINDTNVQLEPILAQLESGEPYKKILCISIQIQAQKKLKCSKQ